MRQKKFIKLYEKHANAIFRFIYLKVGSRDIANDLCSKVFLKFWKYTKENKIKNNKALLYSIARNIIIDYYRKHKETYLDEVTSDLPDNRDKSHQEVYVREMLSKLHPEQREVIILYYIEGMKAKEISKIIHKSIPAVRSLIHRGLEELKKIAEY